MLIIKRGYKRKYQVGGSGDTNFTDKFKQFHSLIWTTCDQNLRLC